MNDTARDDLAAVLGQARDPGDHSPNCTNVEPCRYCTDLAAALLPVVAEIEAKARAEAWDEAAELADTVIVSWQGVAGLHPTAPEPHPAAIAAAGARRTLVVLRSRVAEAFSDRVADSGADQ